MSTMPPSWHANGGDTADGAVCACCGLQSWWTTDGRSWCCVTCHPAPPGAAARTVNGGGDVRSGHGGRRAASGLAAKR